MLLQCEAEVGLGEEKKRVKALHFHRRRIERLSFCNRICLAWRDPYLVQAELTSGSLVEDVQAVGDLMQLGITVPDLTQNFLYVLCQVRDLISYLEIRKRHRRMSEHHK